MVDLPAVVANLAVLSCGHTAWVHQHNELGSIVECSACPLMGVEDGKLITRTRWTVKHLLFQERVPSVVEFADGG